MPEFLQQDISTTAFSRFGSYLAFSRLEGDRIKRLGLPEGVWLRSVHGAAAYEVMLLELIDQGVSVPCESRCTASVLTLTTASGGRVEICLATESTIRIRVQGVTLRLTACPFRNHCAIPETDGNWVFNLARSYRMYRLIPLQGQFTVDAPWTVKQCLHMIAELSAGETGVAEMAIEELSFMRQPLDHSQSFDSVAASVEHEFETFCKPFLNCPEPYRPAVREAAYLDWSCVVHPHGLLKRPTMYMSKNWMTNVWSWDHAFNAWATCLTDVDLAWDQFMVMFDHQDENGQIPDYINDRRLLTCFVKPPVHGWILKRMIEACGELSRARLEEAYTKLSRWTDWWLTYRNPDQDGLPVYWHGNDSGWDNASPFDVPLPLKAADLAAFLVVQMDVLADFARQLGRADEAARWRKRADATLNALLTKLWDGQTFRCVSTVTRKPADPSDSLFNCLPIILGQRLPEAVRTALVVEIKRHLTEWGPATEHPKSPCYEPDGYWRGPIWAPSTMIIVDGLLAAGETALARDIAERFCKLCVQGGFAENFDALTGQPLRDRGYTWTSSVFLVLVLKYLRTKND